MHHSWNSRKFLAAVSEGAGYGYVLEQAAPSETPARSITRMESARNIPLSGAEAVVAPKPCDSHRRPKGTVAKVETGEPGDTGRTACLHHPVITQPRRESEDGQGLGHATRGETQGI